MILYSIIPIILYYSIVYYLNLSEGSESESESESSDDGDGRLLDHAQQRPHASLSGIRVFRV